jgi:hypothetical protein
MLLSGFVRIRRFPVAAALVFGALAVLLSSAPVRADASPPASGHGRLLASDDFRHGTSNWIAEFENSGTLAAANGTLDVNTPAGASVWYKRPFYGNYEIDFTATPVYAGGQYDRVSDLNMFWDARDVRSPEDIFATTRSGALADYDYLTTYYVGFGGNSDTTTRLRRYVGIAGDRPLIYDLASPLLGANTAYHIRLITDGHVIQFWENGELVFNYWDPQPYDSGWFAFRTTWSHYHLSDFRVWRLRRR